jgi:hypothetical protein
MEIGVSTANRRSKQSRMKDKSTSSIENMEEFTAVEFIKFPTE